MNPQWGKPRPNYRGASRLPVDDDTTIDLTVPSRAPSPSLSELEISMLGHRVSGRVITTRADYEAQKALFDLPKELEPPEPFLAIDEWMPVAHPTQQAFDAEEFDNPNYFHSFDLPSDPTPPFLPFGADTHTLFQDPSPPTHIQKPFKKPLAPAPTVSGPSPPPYSPSSPSPPPSPGLQKHTSVFPVSSDTRQRKKRGPRHRPVSPSSPVDPPAPDSDVERTKFDVMVQYTPAQKPPPPGRPSRGKPKATKVEPQSFPPVQLNTGMDLEEVADAVAAAAGTDRAHVKISSFQYKFMKPQNAQFIPFGSTAGLESMMRQVVEKCGPMVIVKIDPPLPRAAPPATQSSQLANNPVDFDYDDDDVDVDEPKKAAFDDEVMSGAEAVRAMYPVGGCKMHPTKSCFHDRTTDLHFEITRDRSLVWSAAKKRGECDFYKAPIGKFGFKATDSLKVTSAQPAAVVSTAPTSEAPAALPATPAIAATVPAQYPFAMPSYPPTPFPYYPPPQAMSYPPPFGQYPPAGYYGNPQPWDATPPGHRPPRFRDVSPPYRSPPYRSRRNHDWSQDVSPPRGRRRVRSPDSSPAKPKRRRMPTPSNPPSSPIPPGGTLDDFFAEYSLPAPAKALLQSLGFQIGDDLTKISGEDWANAGIKFFEIERVLKAYTKYKLALRSH